MEECEPHYQNILQEKQIQFVNSTKERVFLFILKTLLALGQDPWSAVPWNIW